MLEVCAITTIDNPYDPIDDFDHWYLYDETESKHHTCSYLARLARLSDQLSDEENNREIERAIDEILSYDYEGIYKKIKRKLKEN